MIYRLILTCLLGLAAYGTLAGPIGDYGEAINQAGRQRMLSQRIAKAYIQIGQHIWSGKPRRQLDAALRLYQAQLDNLKAFARSDPTQAALAHADAVWQQYREIAKSRIDRKSAVALVAKSEELLQASQAVVEALVAEAGTQKAHIVDLSGRQRMLSQRMAKFYLLLSWGLDEPQYREAFHKAEQEFSTALDELRGSQLNTREIKRLLEQVEKQWRFFELTRIMDEGRYLPSIVASSTERLLRQMNEITGLYAQLSSGD